MDRIKLLGRDRVQEIIAGGPMFDRRHKRSEVIRVPDSENNLDQIKLLERRNGLPAEKCCGSTKNTNSQGALERYISAIGTVLPRALI